MKIRNLAWSGCLLLGAVSAHANLIVNGSFEVPDHGSSWGVHASIPGWTALTNAIEIGNAAVYGVTNHDLDQVLEPDYTSNATVEQMVGTAASQSYLLTFGVAIWATIRERKSAGTTQDYFLAGRNAGWFLVGGSLFASNIGSEHLVGLAGSGATDGVAMAHYELHAWCLLVLGWILVPFYMR